MPENVDTSFKSYMDYRTITDESSTQWELQQQAITDENGLRKIDDFYCVAMGTYYSQECGKKFKITLDNDITIKVLVADIKNNIHTDNGNMYSPLTDKNGEYIYNKLNVQMVNILEFIIDGETLPKHIKKIHGDVSSLGLEGNIIKIEEIVDEIIKVELEVK